MRMFSRAIIILSAAVLSLSVFYFLNKPVSKVARHSLHKTAKKLNEEYATLRTRSAYIKKYVEMKHYNSKICFLVDMNLSSGKNRFFIYNLQKDSVIASGLVAHGNCDNGFQITPTFSNKENTGCSCFGKFRIGESYNGRFGLAYKLYGLDSSNNNAYERNIVLHSYRCVPDEVTEPIPICNSRGCPMVSPAFLEKLKLYLDGSAKPVLLEIFN